MLEKPTAAHLLRVAILGSNNPVTFERMINEWLEKAGSTMVQDIQIQQGEQTTVAMIIFRKQLGVGLDIHQD